MAPADLPLSLCDSAQSFAYFSQPRRAAVPFGKAARAVEDQAQVFGEQRGDVHGDFLDRSLSFVQL